MGLFGFGKEKKESCGCGCCCGSTASSCEEKVSGEGATTVQVLGSGCKSCHTLYENACQAVKEMGSDAKVEYITDMAKVVTFGAMSMPALAVDGKVISSGRVLKAEEIKAILSEKE
jgi:small redox-active disulfide protein 2